MAAPSTLPPLQRYFGTADAAEYLGTTPQGIYDLVRDRRVPFIKVGKALKFDRQRLDAWMRRQAIIPPEPRR